MKQLKSYLLMLIAAFVMVGCADDFDRPPVVAPTAADLDKVNTTIYDLKYGYWDDARNYIDTIGKNEAGEDIYIKGRVISSDATGNIYKSLVIQDETAALALSINQSSLYNTYRVGQEIVIKATGMYIGKYNGLQQLGYPEWYAAGNAWEATFMALELFEQHAQLNDFPNAAAIDTIQANLGSLPSDPEGLCKWQSQLVRFDDVTFTDADGVAVFSGDDASTNRTIQDANGNTLTVRNSNYATFRSEILPVGTGSVVGILSYYGTSWQLLLRSSEDCIGFSTDTKGLKANPYEIADAISLQGTGKGGWLTGYIVGAVKPGVSEVSSSEDIQWAAPTALANTIVLGATADTKDIANCVIIELAEGTALRTAANLKDNESVYQKPLLVKATAFNKVLGQNGVVTSGTASDFELEGSSQGGTGEGTKESPYGVTQTINSIYKSGSATAGWVTGYIVGGVDGKSITENAVFSASTATASNILISDNPNATSISECIPVQLPTGTVRSALNLVDNPGNLGKLVKLNGSVEAYFGVAGLKTVTEYEIEGGSDTPETPQTSDPVTSLNEGFESGIPSTWVNYVASGDKSWYQTTYNSNGYAAMTGYKGTQPPFDNWLITPALNVKDATDKNFSFRTQVNGYGSTTSVFEVYVLTSNDLATATKTQLNPTIATAPASGYSDWAESGNIDLSSYGDVVYVGFRFYATSDSNYATWCVDDVKFGESSGTETPETPETPSTGESSKESPFTVTQAKNTYVEGSQIAAWVSGYIVGFVDGMSISSNAVFGSFTATDDTVKTNLLISDNPNATSINDCIPVQLPSGTVRTALNLVDNPSNLGKKVVLNGSIEKYFGVAGLKSVSEYEIAQ